MSYRVLDKSSVCEYVSSIDTITQYLGQGKLIAEEIGDGNLNYVYIVKNISTDKSIILKQAVPYLRCVGEEFPLSKERMTYEIRALNEFAKITTNSVPTIYHADEEMSVVAMQYLDEHIILRKGLISSTEYPMFAEHMSSFLANSLFKTSSLYLQSKEKRELIGKFNSNTELCKITEDFVFTFAFMEHETNNENAKNNDVARELFIDSEFKKSVLSLKYKFMNQTDALLHGDLHTGSIMANESDTYVIDPEFAFVGPFGFDVGALVGNLIASFVSHLVQDENESYRVWVLKSIKDILVMFEDKFLRLWSEHRYSALRVDGFIDDYYFEDYQKEFMKNILKDTVGFAGCKLARRVFGIAGVEDIRGIEEEEIKASAEKLALDIARELVKGYQQVESVDDIIDVLIRFQKSVK
jgi:5-methylthioribose kinase